MFSIGDTVIYGAHGVCSIDGIQEQAFLGEMREYYLLRPLHNPTLELYHLVETEHSKLTPIPSEERAEIILQVFKNPPDIWHERVIERSRNYQIVLETNNHLQIAQMVNTLMRRRLALEDENKKLPNQDAQLLKQVSPILYEELAISLHLSINDVTEKIEQIIQENRSLTKK